MSPVQAEHLEERRLLSTITFANPGGTWITKVYQGDANLDGSVNVVDLLVLAANYGKPTGAIWSNGDFNYDGAVNFDDMLSLAFNYGVPNGAGRIQGEFQYLDVKVRLAAGTVGTFVSDWAMVRDALRSDYGNPEITSAGVAGNRLIIELGSSKTVELRAKTSKSGVLRVYASDTSMPLVTVKAYRVSVVQVFDSGDSHAITLDASFPAAHVALGGGDDLLFANHQPNTIYGGSGDDTIYAGGGDDVVYGEEGSDRLFGEGGDDTLFGGAHKDYLDGGSGRNILVGGSGTDYFSVRSKDKTDREDRDRVTVID